jgi:peptidoglycan/xylan/chitin deacetylase (PgdA/CDA1 family)
VITFDDGWLDNYLYAYPVLKRYGIPATIFLPTEFIGTHRWFWPDQISYLLGHDQRDQRNGLLDSLTARYPWLEPRNGRQGKKHLDAVIERCKPLPESEIQEIIRQLSEALKLKLPEERILLNWEEIREMSTNGISFGSHSCSHKILAKLSVQEIDREVRDSLRMLKEKKINDIPVFCYPNGDYTVEISNRVKQAGYQAAVGTHPGLEAKKPADRFGLKRISIHQDISATLPLFAWHISGLNRILSRG